MAKSALTRHLILPSFSPFSWRCIWTSSSLAAKPEHERVDRYCNWLREKLQSEGASIDWKSVRDEFRSRESGLRSTGLPLAFEIKTINCLLKIPPDDGRSALQGLLNFLTTTTGKTIKNPVYDVHVAALKAEVDPVKYNQELKKVVTEYQSNSVLSRDVAFMKSLTQLSSVSIDDCLFCVKVVENNPLILCKAAIAVNCLSFGLFSEAIDLIVGYEHLDLWLNQNMDSWMESMNEHNASVEVLIRFFQLLSSTSVILTNSSEKRLEQVARKLSYSWTDSVVTQDGICRSCGHLLDNFSDEDLTAFSTRAKKIIIDREDVFFNSTPQEVSSFINFIEQTRRTFKKSKVWFDCVIDGLNACHVRHALVFDMAVKPKQKDRRVGSYVSKELLNDNLSKVVSRCLQLFQGRILLFGRRHMNAMPSLRKLKDHPRITVYLIDDDSRDDPFMIYAALQSNHTYVVTNDMFRDHKFLMEDQLMERWLRARLIGIPKDLTSLVIPPIYEVRANVARDGNCVHIPIQGTFSSHLKWVCCRRSESSSQTCPDVKQMKKESEQLSKVLQPVVQSKVN